MSVLVNKDAAAAKRIAESAEGFKQIERPSPGGALEALDAAEEEEAAAKEAAEAVWNMLQSMATQQRYEERKATRLQSLDDIFGGCVC